GNRHVLRVIREILSLKPAGRGTDIPAALEHLGLVTKRRCVVFLISDFLTPGWRGAPRRQPPPRARAPGSRDEAPLRRLPHLGLPDARLAARAPCGRPPARRRG